MAGMAGIVPDGEVGRLAILLVVCLAVTAIFVRIRDAIAVRVEGLLRRVIDDADAKADAVPPPSPPSSSLRTYTHAPGPPPAQSPSLSRSFVHRQVAHVPFQGGTTAATAKRLTLLLTMIAAALSQAAAAADSADHRDGGPNHSVGAPGTASPGHPTLKLRPRAKAHNAQ